MDSLQMLCSTLEPLLRKVVSRADASDSLLPSSMDESKCLTFTRQCPFHFSYAGMSICIRKREIRFVPLCHHNRAVQYCFVLLTALVVCASACWHIHYSRVAFAQTFVTLGSVLLCCILASLLVCLPVYLPACLPAALSHSIRFITLSGGRGGGEGSRQDCYQQWSAKAARQVSALVHACGCLHWKACFQGDRV